MKILAGIVCLIAFIALMMALEVGGIKWSGVVNPMREEVRREVYENTRSYNEGKEQDLARFRLQYLKGNPEDRSALESTIQIMFANFDASHLNSPELKQFLYEIRGY